MSIGSLDVIPTYQDNFSKFLLRSLSQLPLLAHPIFALQLRHEFPIKSSLPLDRPACFPDYQDGPLASKFILSDIPVGSNKYENISYPHKQKGGKERKQ